VTRSPRIVPHPPRIVSRRLRHGRYRTFTPAALKHVALRADESGIMRLVPRDLTGTLTFFQTRAATWADRADEIGTTPEAVAQMAAKLADAKAAYLAQQQAINAARSATATFRRLTGELAESGADIIKSIRAKAATDGDAIYVAASISPPKKRSPLPVPGTPTNFSFALDAIGQLTLKWQCKNPRGAVGTVYMVSRRLAGSEKFESLATTGTKQFTDSTLPAGAASVEYQVIAVRSTGSGEKGRYTVNFGNNSGGAAGGVPFQTTRRSTQIAA
jgi:hypothetical protein